MTSIPLHPSALHKGVVQPTLNPLPKLLHAEFGSGYTLLEIQGSVNLPPMDEENPVQETPIGRLIFPDYHPDLQAPGDTGWMKRVYMYVGKHQRMTGEVKKLPKAIAIIRKRDLDNEPGSSAEAGSGERTEELEIVEIVKYKIIFSHRPEPVGTWTEVVELAP